MFEIKVDMLRLIDRHQKLLFFGQQLPGATVAAINDTLVELREQAVATLGGIVNAPREQISSRVLIEPAARTTRIAAAGAIYISQLPIPLKHLSPEQSAAGVTYSPVTGTNKTIKHAFGPDIPRLGRGVWRRVGKSRTPIEKVPGGFNMARSKVVKAALGRVVSQAGPILQRNLDARITHFLTELQSGRRTYGPTYINRESLLTIRFGRTQSIVTRR
jgi:hypothetical protein